MQNFNRFFTKDFTVFTSFTEKEGQIINLIKSNEIAVIILIIFTTELTKKVSSYILNYGTNIYRIFSDKKFLTLIFLNFS